MKITSSKTSGCFNTVMFALALVATLLPGLIRPQTARAQRAGTAGGDGALTGAMPVIIRQSQYACGSFLPSKPDELHQSDRDNANDGQNGSMDIADAARHDPRLAAAISDIETAWNKHDIRALSRHVHRDMPVVVYVRGKYFYSLDGDNYLSMTRDAFSATKTVSFVLDRMEQKDRGVYSVSGRHTYTDRENKSHTVLVSYMLNKADDDYFLTRVGTEPAKLPASGPTDGQMRQPINPGLATQPSLLPRVIHQETVNRDAVKQEVVKQETVKQDAVKQEVVKRSPLPSSPHRFLSPPGIYAYPYDYSALQYHLTGAALDDYFPARSVHYPHYSLHYFSSVTAPSVYYYDDGAIPPYIGTVSIINQPPRNNYVPYPLYTSDGLYRGELGNANDGQNAYTTIAYAIGRDPLLANAISDLLSAWNQQDIRALSKHVGRDMPVAVFLRGKYFYSLDGGDYLCITRDAFSVKQTVRLALDRVQRKTGDIYTVSGRHTYTDGEGKSHIVLVSFVLNKVFDDYYLTQVGAAPEKLEQ